MLGQFVAKYMQFPAVASFAFLGYAALDAALAAVLVKRVERGANQPKRWQEARGWFLAGVLGTLVDNLRLFAGGFYSGSDKTPWWASSIYLLSFMHSVLVPLFATPIYDLAMAARATKASSSEKKPRDKVDLLRVGVQAVSGALALVGLVNVVAEIKVTSQITGFRRAQVLGVSVYRMADDATVAQNVSLFIPGVSLAGVLWFSLVEVIAGAYIWYHTGSSLMFNLSFGAFMGQGAGPVSPIYFFLASNLMEVFAFSALVLGDLQFFRLPKPGK